VTVRALVRSTVRGEYISGKKEQQSSLEKQPVVNKRRGYCKTDHRRENLWAHVSKKEKTVKGGRDTQLIALLKRGGHGVEHLQHSEASDKAKRRNWNINFGTGKSRFIA